MKHTGRPLPGYLWDIKEEIRQYATDYGLDFFETVFEILDYDQMNEVAARTGAIPRAIPTGVSAWSTKRSSKSYKYGLSKIYEMVINNDPCYAYLLEGNHLVDQKIVMAHVYGHCDFFKNNYWFSKTNRKMIDEMANHSTRVRKYAERFGMDAVESFLDVCLSLENLIDYHAPFIVRSRKKPRVTNPFDEAPEASEVPRIKQAREYMDSFVNPEEFLAEQRAKMAQQQEKEERFPSEPERDVFGFLMNHAPLRTWQRDVMSIVREEAYYFAPQGQTKIMNEGWATYWHSKIMTHKALDASEIVDYADHHAGVVARAPGRLNPYTLGLELFRNIEERWNKGQFGAEWQHCDDAATRRNWDKQLGQGREKIFEVRRHHNDVTFLDEFFTMDFCREHRYFAYDYNQRSSRYEISSREFREVKNKLLFQLTNFGQPFIVAVDGDFEHRSELLLHHRHEGVDLRMDHAHDTMENLFKVWTRPVHVMTIVDGNGKLLTFDGKEHSEKSATYEKL